MARIKSLRLSGKIILLSLILMIVVFAALYIVANSRSVLIYRGAVFTQKHENGSMVYSGRIDGKKASFTVVPEKEVVYRLEDKVYGPYTVSVTPDAIPEDMKNSADLGVELYSGDELIFRGAAIKDEEGYVFYREPTDDEFFPCNTPELALSENGLIDPEFDFIVIDCNAPYEEYLLSLAFGPKTERRGNWGFYLIGLVFCALTAAYVIFADEIFRYHASRLIRNAENVEPSEVELSARPLAWFMLTSTSFIILVLGLFKPTL